MIFTVKDYLTFSALFAAFGVAVCGQYPQKGHDGGYNDISEAEEDNKYPYQPYGFGYDIEDGYGNKQWRHEKSQQPSNVIGSYGFKDKDGIMREVEYIADKNGFRARIKTNEPGTAPKDPGDVKFEAQPVMVSNYAKNSHRVEQEEQPSKDSQENGNYNNNNNGQQQDYQPNSSRLHRIQHRIGRPGRTSRTGYAAASTPKFTFIPYYS